MLQQWALLASVVIVVLSYCEQQVQAQFLRRGFGLFPHKGPFGGFGAHRKPHLGWVLAANPNAHEDDGDQTIVSRSAAEEGYDEDLQVVHYGDHVEDLQDLGLEPSPLIGFFNEDGTVDEWSGVGEELVGSGVEEIVGRKHQKLDCHDIFGKHKKKKRKFCRKMGAYDDDHYGHGGHYGYGHGSYGHGHGGYGGHKHHKHHKHGSYGRYKRHQPYLSGAQLPLQQLPLGGLTSLTHSLPLAGTLRQLPVHQLNRHQPAREQDSSRSYGRYKRQLPYFTDSQLPLGIPQIAQSTPLSGAVQLLPVQQITQINRPRLVRNSIVPSPDPPPRLAQVKFLDANGSEMLTPYQLKSLHHEQHPCPSGTVANYNFFHFSCPPTVTVDGATLRNHPKRYIDTTNAWSQFPHRIEKRKGVEQQQPPPPPKVNVERVFALESATVEATPDVSTTEADRSVTTDSPTESLRKPLRRKTKPTRTNKIFQRKLIQWRLQNIRDKATSEETTLEPIVVLSSRESVEEGVPVNRLRDTRDSNMRPLPLEMSEDRVRPRPYSNRGEQFLSRMFAPPVSNANPFDTFHRDHRTHQNQQQAHLIRTTPRRNSRRGEKLVSRFIKARQHTTSTAAPTTTTTTTPEPTTTTTTTLRTTLTTKRFPLKHNMDEAARRRTRYRLRPKKSIQDDEYEALGKNTLEVDTVAARKAEPTKRRPQTPRRAFRLGKIKPLKVKKPAREDAVTESLVKQGRWEEIFALKTNENKRNHPRRSVDEPELARSSQQDARWRLKRAQQFIRRQFRNWRTADPLEAPTTTTTTTTTTVRPMEGEDRRHRRPVRPVGRQGRQRSESSELVNLGRFDVNGQLKNPMLQSAASNQEGVLSPKVQEFIASKVKEACDKCMVSNEIVRSKNNYVPRTSRADHVGTRSKNAVYCEPRERSLRTSTPSTAASFAASPLRTLFKLDLFKPWRNLIAAQSSQS